ncbi:MAG: TetR/AcrR family transcriptional regulator [Spirochaetes bacterium]|nr:TetR/AcrR family transcriptional regulator [Spirochaetota bacterium]
MSQERTIRLLKNSEKESELLLYNELGQYFSANGVFDEFKFGEIITNHITRNEITDKNPSDLSLLENWISDYVDGIIEYLSNKNMFEAAARLFKVALEKCRMNGIEKISISPVNLEKIMSIKIKSAAESDQQKTSPDGKRNLIFRAARKVFSEDGFHRATMDKIAATSGVGKGSLYRYFKSKEELLDSLLEEEYKAIVNNIADIFNRNDDVIDGLVEMIQYWVNFISDNPDVYNLIQSADVSVNTIAGKSRFYKYMSQNLPLLKARIISLNKDLKVKGIDYLTVIYGMFGFIDGVYHKWFGSDMSYPITDEIPVILETLFNGCVGEKRSDRKYINNND